MQKETETCVPSQSLTAFTSKCVFFFCRYTISDIFNLCVNSFGQHGYYCKFCQMIGVILFAEFWTSGGVLVSLSTWLTHQSLSDDVILLILHVHHPFINACLYMSCFGNAMQHDALQLCVWVSANNLELGSILLSCWNGITELRRICVPSSAIVELWDRFNLLINSSAGHDYYCKFCRL
jgi:hypothetical protein